MIKLLIVEDETMERRFLCDHIRWEIIGAQVIGGAWNGKEALETVIASRPDIILTDVKMPVMDGVELAKMVQAIDPSVKIIFHSAYDDFEYAREAANLHAFGYILKPIDEEELLKRVKKAVDMCIQEQMHEAMLAKLRIGMTMGEPVLREALVRDLLLGEEAGRDELLRHVGLDWLIAPGAEITLALVRWSERGAVASSEVLHEAEAALRPFRHTPAVRLSAYEAAVLLLADARQAEAVEACFASLAARVSGKYGAAVRYLIENAVIGEIKLHVRFAQLYRRLESGPAADGPDVHGLNVPAIRQFKEEFSRLVRMKDDGQLRALIRAFCEQRFAREPADLPYYIGLGFSVLSLVADAVKSKGHDPFRTADEEIRCWMQLVRLDSAHKLKQFVLNRALAMAEKLGDGKKRSRDQLIERIELIVKQRYHEPLSVEYIAGLMHFTPNYIGATYKTKRNISINDYINKIRVSRSMELLREETLSITDIALMCGYENAPYFHKMFKKHTGSTPGEFRQQANRQAGSTKGE